MKQILVKIWNRIVENHHNYDRLHSKYITHITIDIIVEDHGENNNNNNFKIKKTN
jgi:hypothetical protein